MTNAELFKKTFGIYSEEFWSYTEKQMLDWINADVPDTNVGDTISRQAAVDALDKRFDGFPMELTTEILELRRDLRERIPSAQPSVKEPCDLCKDLEKGDTLYQSSSWDGGVGYDYIHNIQYCPKCGRKLEEWKT